MTRNRQIRILIAEPEPDMHCLYRILEWISKCLGLEVLVIENGSKCIEYFLESNDKGGFDMLILDSHFCDINWVEVIKLILKKMPNQRIVFTTTYSLNQISNIIESLGIDKETYF
jgi:hypothetical protein